MTTNCHQFKTWLSDQDIEDKSLEREARDHMETCEICKKLATVDSLIEARVREGLRQVGIHPENSLPESRRIFGLLRGVKRMSAVLSSRGRSSFPLSLWQLSF
jgi:hypothetical protein